MLLLKAGKKGGHVESTVDDECSPVRAAKLIACSLHSPPFFPATMLLLKAGKKGGGGKGNTIRNIIVNWKKHYNVDS